MGARRVGVPGLEMATHAGRRLLLQCPSRIAYCGSMMRRYLSAYRRGSVITGRFSVHGALKSGQVGVRLVATRQRIDGHCLLHSRHSALTPR